LLDEPWDRVLGLALDSLILHRYRGVICFGCQLGGSHLRRGCALTGKVPGDDDANLVGVWEVNIDEPAPYCFGGRGVVPLDAVNAEIGRALVFRNARRFGELGYSGGAQQAKLELAKGQRRGCRVAARGTRAATRRDAPRRISECVG
jgi:hypothetical protein